MFAEGQDDEIQNDRINLKDENSKKEKIPKFTKKEIIFTVRI